MESKVKLTKKDVDAVIEKTVSRFRKINTDISFDKIPTDQDKQDRILPSMSVKCTRSYDFPYEEELKKILEEEIEKALSIKSIKAKQQELIRHKIFSGNNKGDGMSKLRKITQEELHELLKLNKLWLESKGKEGEKINFERANLTVADFRDAYLRSTDFRGVKLEGANISHLTKVEFLDSTITDEHTILTNVKFKEK